MKAVYWFCLYSTSFSSLCSIWVLINRLLPQSRLRVFKPCSRFWTCLTKGFHRYLQKRPRHSADNRAGTSTELGFALYDCYVTGEYQGRPPAFPRTRFGRPVDWVTQISILLRDDAMRSYIAQKKEMKEQGKVLDWDGMKRWLKGNLARYSENFRTHLPPDIARDLRREKPTKPEEMYHAARELDRLSNLYRGTQNHGSSLTKKAKNFFRKNPQRSPAIPESFTPPVSISTPPAASTGPVPMDLDVMQPMSRNSSGARTDSQLQPSRSRPCQDLHAFENALLFKDALPESTDIEDQLGCPELHNLVIGIAVNGMKRMLSSTREQRALISSLNSFDRFVQKFFPLTLALY
ncbi:hypothetical protein SCP_0311510 [Sparassis crispa]|uniref:Retrotransposon gag domain-containing protein n=1 Tax=Sparassis crispa TaxID=139825 RepID=A0A401GGY2_9APHY|nr:hypothetical protein SCP_0311510 [Sparassis crispa]GBE81422.1 hypothetical protein SCP_0311510 [Sparassis crispa]